MNGKEFNRRLAKECKLTQQEAGEIVKSIIKLITEELTGGGSITLTGLGKFYTAEYRRRNIKTPQGEMLEIKPHSVAKFKPSDRLKCAVSGH